MNKPTRQFRIHPALAKPIECCGCVLEHDGIGFARPEGTGALRVLILGEALGPNEAKDGFPFRPYALAGSMLDRALRLCGYTREQFAVFNVVNCLPPGMELFNTPYELSAAQHCRVYLNRVIAQYKPACILALGNVPLRSLTGFAGKKQTIDYMRGFALSSPEFPGVPIVCSYHPSFLQRGAFNLIPVLCRDIKYAVNIARNGFHPAPVEYIEHAGVNELKYLIEHCNTERSSAGELIPISVDFETEGNPNVFEDQQLMDALEDLYGEPGAQKKTKKKRERLGTEQLITQVNISVQERQSFVFQYTPDVQPYVNKLLQLSNPKIGHNVWAFDQAIAEFNGLEWNGDTDDTMIMFHCLFPDVPGRVGKMQDVDGTFANLQYCASFYGFDQPWKHIVSDQPELYGAMDSDATLRLYNGVKRDMQAMRYGKSGPTVWDGYRRLCAELWPILHSASRRGIPVNREKMLRFLDSVVGRQREMGKQIQRMIPDELMPVKQKVGLKKQPKDTTGYVMRDFVIESETVRCKCFRVKKTNVEYWLTVTGAEINEKDGKLRAPDPDCIALCDNGWVTHAEHTETRWCKLEAFNPNSPVQMKRYAAFHNHKIPRNKEGKIAMDKWALEQMERATRDPLYPATRSYRQFEKMTAYAIGWMPHGDGRAHPEFSYFPATGQISSFNPNAQNVMSLSKYGVLAEEFRDGVEAPDGFVIIELDLKSFHAQTLGFEADCPEYIRLAKIDVHSYVACAMLKVAHVDECLDWDDEELRAWLKWYRKNYTCPDGTPFQKIRDERAKVGVLAFGLGQGAGSLFTSNRDSFLPDWYLLGWDDPRRTLYDADHRRADREGLKAAENVHAALNERFPKLKHYRETMPLVAKQNGNKLISRYGCVRWFWDIQHFDARKKEMVRGGDWEKAISFFVQNDGHGYLKYALLRLHVDGLLERYGFINTIHDSVVFCCPKDLVEECVVNVKAELERPSEVLMFDDGSGLSVECEAKVGRTWGKMEEITV